MIPIVMGKRKRTTIHYLFPIVGITILASLGTLIWLLIYSIPKPDLPATPAPTPTNNVTYADFDIAFTLAMLGNVTAINHTLFASQLQSQIVNVSGALSNQVFVTSLTNGSIIAQIVFAKVSLNQTIYPTEQLLQRFSVQLPLRNNSFFIQYPIKTQSQQLIASPVTPLSLCKNSKYFSLCNSNCANSSYCTTHGTCQINTDTCLCLPGYNGVHCSSIINNCLIPSNPCQNNGNCTNQINNHTCNCPPGFKGLNCEINSCVPNLCENNSTCIGTSTGDHYQCTCKPGYNGTNCEDIINNCDPEPCMNNGTCSNIIGNGTYTCNCLDDYYGNNCNFLKRDVCPIYEPCAAIANNTCVFIDIYPYYQCVGPFASTWTLFSGANQLTLPLPSAGVYNFTVFWGDGLNSTQVTSPSQAVHTYNISGPVTYQVVIIGQIQGFGWAGVTYIPPNDPRLQLFEISQWGVLSLLDTGAYFNLAQNLVVTATDNLNLTGVTSLANMFKSCPSLTRINGNWNTSTITNMQSTFDGAYNFNSPLLWDTSSVTTMNSMFNGANVFNQPLHWNTKKVTVFDFMFNGAFAFNNDLSSFSFESTSSMKSMLSSATSFNHPSVVNWNTGQVTTMSGIFSLTSNFNQPIGNWNVSNALDLSSLFNQATAFNQPIGNWSVGNCVLFTNMFSSATAFNQDLSRWDVRKSRFFNNFLAGATAFSTQNYDALLTGWWTTWGTQLQASATLVVASHYTCNSTAASARANLTSIVHWTITDSGCV